MLRFFLVQLVVVLLYEFSGVHEGIEMSIREKNVEARKKKIRQLDVGYSQILKSSRNPKLSEDSIPNPLPDLDEDLSILLENMVPLDVEKPNVPNRADFLLHCETITYEFRGQSELLPIFVISIASIRRKLHFLDHALAVFFKILDTYSEYLSHHLVNRYLISVLRTLSEYGRNDGERFLGLAGFSYASLIRAYEVERKINGLPLDKMGFDLPHKGEHGGMERFYYIPGHDDALSSLNKQMYLHAKNYENIAAPFILAMMAELQEGKNLFNRVDRALRENHETEIDERRWSFGYQRSAKSYKTST